MLIPTVRRAFRFFTPRVLILLFAAFSVAVFLVHREIGTSWYQAWRLSKLAGDLKWEMRSGPDEDFARLALSQSGPYDIRLGYSRLPRLLQNLEKHGFEVQAQAHASRRMKDLVRRGVFVPYREKSQAGLEITGSNGQSLYRVSFPRRIYDKFESVPSVITSSLLFIENRELLDEGLPKKNPAIDWTRLGRAILDKGIQVFNSDHDVPGGSTLATQIEKYRHSPNGLTLTGGDKFRQIASASVRAYLEGDDTLAVRKQILVDYLNTVPLAGALGFGETNGIGDALWVWYGLDFDETNRILNWQYRNEAEFVEAAGRYKHVLSLMIAQRRPSYYLMEGRQELGELTNAYLRVLTQVKVIPSRLRDAALRQPLRFRNAFKPQEIKDFSSQKAVNAARVRLASQLGLQGLYDLDRLDLSVQSTLDIDLQKKTTEMLRQLRDPVNAVAAGLYGHRLLGKEDPSKIIYSFTLSELTPDGAKFRILADNFDQPLDINKGTKLDLGSTAKLRTLVTYLEIVEALHGKYAAWEQKALRAEEVDPSDALSRWAIDHLLHSRDKSLKSMLSAAMERKYSASPYERFFTGGGQHVFHNFKPEDNYRIMSVREATTNSVNLVYIRLMRDIVRYYMLQVGESSAKILRDASNSDRGEYLRRFADKEGRVFINRFYLKYKDKAADPREVSDIFFSSFRHTPRRLAAAYRYIYPASSFVEFVAFMTPHLSRFKNLDTYRLEDLYEAYAPGKYSLADQGYIVTVHPLELWLARYLILHPGAGYKGMIEASAGERIAVYSWLFKTIHKNSQDSRIRNLLEVEAFLEIHRSWKRLGYPFDSLVPSLATAIGSSADHPAALAELMGIILNDGVRVPALLIERLRFAADTPFETIVEKKPVKGERVFSPELAATVRGVLTKVVTVGTASRLAHAIVEEDGSEILIGGKTGTGDHRHITFSSPGVIKESRVVNRSATFVFFIGDRFFGTMTAFVPGVDAANYTFTSALSTQVMKKLVPVLKPIIDRPPSWPKSTLAEDAIRKTLPEEKEKPEPASS
ncbi:MAG: glycosyl transferase family 51 [Nitrosomonadales bacterium SCN 54-20]|nr:MAG: glycosyl transferase family 51 [Nitrosomonadales bacterium SCN 54-20]